MPDPVLRVPLLVPAIRLDGVEGLDPEAEKRRALRRAAAPWCAGFLLFGGEAEEVACLTRRLREVAGRDLLMAADMERGAGQQVQGLTLLPEAALFGLGATGAQIEAYGHATAREALSVGIDVIFAPVLDVASEPRNPILGHRAFGWDPGQVAAQGVHFLRGIQTAGALGVGKHYPGHGATTLDSHVARPVVDAPEAVLLARDLVPFDRALDAGVLGAVMTAHVVFPALDPERRIATASLPILTRLRARAAPRDIVVITDALRMTGAGGDVVLAADEALEAGCDLLLYADKEEEVAASLLEEGPREAAALDRIEAWLATRGQPDPGAGRALLAQDSGAQGLSEAVADAAVARVGVPPAQGMGPVWIFDDDGVSGRGQALLAAAEAQGRPCRLVPLPREAPPSPAALAEASLVVLLASVRMAKGPAGLSPRARALVAALPRGAGGPLLVALGAWVAEADVHLPGTHPALEGVVAARLFPQ